MDGQVFFLFVGKITLACLCQCQCKCKCRRDRRWLCQSQVQSQSVSPRQAASRQVNKVMMIILKRTHAGQAIRHSPCMRVCLYVCRLTMSSRNRHTRRDWEAGVEDEEEGNEWSFLSL